MIKNKWTKEQIDGWWEKYLTIGEDSAAIVDSCTFQLFKLRIGWFIKKRRKYVPQVVRDYAIKSLNEFLDLRGCEIYDGDYIDAFGFACGIMDIGSAVKAFDKADKKFLYESDVPGYFYTWFERTRKKHGI